MITKSKEQQVQAEQMAPVTLTLPPGAFIKAIESVIRPGKINLNSDENWEIAKGVISQFKELDGTLATFTTEQWNAFKLIIKPTEDAQRTVLKDTLAATGHSLAPDAEQAMAMLFSPAQFASYLAEKVNPATGKPFLTIQKKRGVKKKAFDALLVAAPTPAPTLTPAAENEQPTAATEKPAAAAE